MFVITVIYEYIVRYKHEISLLKHAEPNQVMEVVRYNREFVIAVIVITEFDCNLVFLKTWVGIHKTSHANS